MVLVDNINVPPEVLELWEKSCVLNTGFFGDKVDKKNIVWRKRNFKSLIAQSAFPSVAQLWGGLTEQEQFDWDDAGYWSGQSGWDLFVQDTLYRINNNIPGLAIPNVYHQFKVGRIQIESPAEEIEIRQNYNVQFNDFASWAFNVLANLTSTGSGSFARIRVHVEFHDPADDPGEVVDWDWDYDISTNDEWDYFGDDYDFSTLQIFSFYFEVHIYKMRGTVYIDGTELIYNDQNLAYDSQCNYFEFNWDRLTVPSGASILSVYPPD
ncbi:MAG: hypothetical protein WAV16_02075 [Candidatus Moraniibacteriota bacterium]